MEEEPSCCDAFVINTLVECNQTYMITTFFGGFQNNNNKNKGEN